MLANRFPRLPIWILAVALIGLTPIACATEEEAKQEETKAAESSGEQKAEEEVKVYTNADLEKMFADESANETVPPTQLPPAPESAAKPEESAKPAEPAKPPAESKPSDPLSLMQQQQAQKEERQRNRAEAEKAVADARARVEQLEERIMALKNPYRARPVIPDDEKEDWDSMGTRQRLEDSEEKLRLAREELAKVEKELAGIQ
jgi:hypothetical protein